MKQVEIHDAGDPIAVKTNTRLLEALQQSSRPVMMACGGKGLCATCHVYVEAATDGLSPPTPREQRSLLMLRDALPSSRLACQAKIRGSGVRIRLPGGRFIQSATDVEHLIGRRADQQILHPADGRVLIETGKIITRGRITQLASVDVDVAELKKMSLTAV